MLPPLMPRVNVLSVGGLMALLACLSGCGRIANHPIVGVAKEEVSRNPRVIELLGGPVEFSDTINGRANETDGIAAMQFEAKGPKASGLVVVGPRQNPNVDCRQCAQRTNTTHLLLLLLLLFDDLLGQRVLGLVVHPQRPLKQLP